MKKRHNEIVSKLVNEITLNPKSHKGAILNITQRKLSEKLDLFEKEVSETNSFNLTKYTQLTNNVTKILICSKIRDVESNASMKSSDLFDLYISTDKKTINVNYVNKFGNWDKKSFNTLKSFKSYYMV